MASNYFFKCLFCGSTYGQVTLKCPKCGGLTIVKYESARFEINRSKPSIWRYSLLPRFSKIISKGEGLTPIVKVGGVLVKNERFNPTGTYADRASSIIASYIASNSITAVRVPYERDFTRSLAYYLAGLAKLYIDIPDVLAIDSLELLALEEVGVEPGVGEEALNIGYVNPLTVEGLKTIAFEVYEASAKVENIVVPAISGTLALSIAKGLEELRELGHNHSYNVIAVITKERETPELLKTFKTIKVVEVKSSEALELALELARKGVKTSVIAALSYKVAENLGNSLAVLTMGFKRTVKLRTDSEYKRKLIEVLRNLGEATAYQLWKEAPFYTLRGTYKMLLAMERRGEICSEIRARGKRKVKYYKLC